MDDKRVKVFICHSAIGEAETEALIRALQKALEPEYPCFVDWTELVIGTPWREGINTWLEHCDAAIVMLNRKAVDSPFVAYEVSELMRRHKLTDGGVAVIPVHIKNADPKLDVGYGTLKNSNLSPWQIDEVHPEVFDPGTYGKNAVARRKYFAKFVAAIKKRLIKIKVAKQELTPQMTDIVELLKKVKPPAVVTSVLKKIDMEVRPFRAVTDDLYIQLALTLRSLGLERARPLIQQLRGDMCDADNHWKEGHLQKLFDLLAYFWVDPHSAATIGKTALGDRAMRNLALHAGKSKTAKMYVQRACPTVPKDNEWQFAPVQVVGGEELGNPERVSNMVRECLIERMRTSAQDLAGELQYADEIKNPIFAALPCAGLTEAMLKRLRDDFGTVTFLFLTRMSTSPALAKAKVTELIPKLDPKDEDAFHDTYDKIWKALRPQCG